jgi:hypothetical protein
VVYFPIFYARYCENQPYWSRAGQFKTRDISFIRVIRSITAPNLLFVLVMNSVGVVLLHLPIAFYMTQERICEIHKLGFASARKLRLLRENNPSLGWGKLVFSAQFR